MWPPLAYFWVYADIGTVVPIGRDLRLEESAPAARSGVL